MATRLLIATLLLTALLAGCSGSTTETDVPVVDPVIADLTARGANFTADGGVSFDYSASSCAEAVLLLAVEPATAQASLPEGWVAADLQDVLMTPVATGKAGVWLNGYRCGVSGQGAGELHGAELGIVVQAPEIANATIPDADLHVYLAAQVTSSENFTAILDHVGVPALRPSLSTTVVRTGVPDMDSSYVEFAVTTDNSTHSFKGLATQTEVMTISAHFWHQTATGLAYTRYEIVDVPIQQGVAADCSFTGLAAELAGSDGCLPGPAFSMVAPTNAWTATFHHVPGASVA